MNQNALAALPSGRLNKFGGPNLLTLDIDRRRRAGAQKPRRRSSRVPLGPCEITQTQLQQVNVTGNWCFGTTTPSVLPLRVTLTFGARRVLAQIDYRGLTYDPMNSLLLKRKSLVMG